jgi:hypothetical protein
VGGLFVSERWPTEENSERENFHSYFSAAFNDVAALHVRENVVSPFAPCPFHLPIKVIRSQIFVRSIFCYDVQFRGVGEG